MPRPLKELKIPKNRKLTPELAFAVVVRERRIALGMDQAELEDDGMDRSYVSKIELAQRQVALRGIITIARKLGMEPDDLLREVVRRMEGKG